MLLVRIMDVIKLIKAYQSHFRLKDYFSENDSNDKTKSVLCENNQQFIQLIPFPTNAIIML